MLFVDLQFFIFFAIVLAVYWTLPRNNQRKNFLFLVSYFFYGSWDWRFAIGLLCISSMDYFMARRIDAARDERTRLWCLGVSLAMNLGVLGFFKYCNFFIKTGVGLAGMLGVQLDQPTLKIILPIGISFLTFQSLSYTIDVYRRQLKPVRVMRDYLLFAAFFPQLVAGPIVRPVYFLPQLAEKRAVTGEGIRASILLFLVGFFKKACIADNIAPFVDHVFNDPLGYGRHASITAVWLYATQIYCDFSGYSDMAIAVAGMMGYRLVLNFDAPYLAASIQDFWRRWHISLSTWIRDYIYISLGGRAKSLLITYRNLLLTMLAGGLWHGAAWTFVVWGGLHGLALIANHEFNRWFPRPERTSIIRRTLGWAVTLFFVTASWVFFRSSGFTVAGIMLKRYLLLDRGGTGTLPAWLTLLPPALLFLQWAARRGNWAEAAGALQPYPFAMLCGAACAVIVALLPLGNLPFIYFQF